MKVTVELYIKLIFIQLPWGARRTVTWIFPSILYFIVQFFWFSKVSKNFGEVQKIPPPPKQKKVPTIQTSYQKCTMACILYCSVILVKIVYTHITQNLKKYDYYLINRINIGLRKLKNINVLPNSCRKKSALHSWKSEITWIWRITHKHKIII